MSRFLLLVSAAAGSTEDAAVAAAQDVLGDAERVTTGTPAELEAALDRLDGRTLVVAGGDGSLHLVVRQLVARGELGRADLGLVPLGTGNDLARGLGLPLEPAQAARVVRDEPARPLDLLVDDTGGVVVNAVHVGLGADAAEAAQRWKPRLGPLAYPVGAVLAGVRPAGWRLRVELDGRVLSRGRTLMVAVGNGSAIGGGTPLLPDARPDDGLLDVVVSRAVGPLARLRYATQLTRGAHVDREDVVTAQGRRVTVSGEPVAVDADGELGDPVARRSWTLQPGAWRLRRPVTPQGGDGPGRRTG